MQQRDAQPRGQVLIVVAAGIVVIVAIAALVIDIGFSWMLHRHEQNAVDPASIAAARWLRDSAGDPRSPFPEAYQEACFYAKQNGFFTTDTADCAIARAAGSLEVNWPPTSGDYQGRMDAVQVVIRDTHPSFFGAIFGQRFATVTTGAVAINSAGNSNSASLVALQSDCSAGAAGQVSGGGTVTIFPVSGVPGDGGYVHVNSPCGTSNDDVCQNGSGQSALQISGTLITPFAYVHGSCTYNGTGANGLQCPVGVTTCLDEGHEALADPLANLPEPRLSDFPNGTCPNGLASTPASTSGCTLKTDPLICPDDGSGVGVCDLTPGVYYGGWRTTGNVTVHLEPGMYILAGGGIQLTAGSSIEAVSGTDGSGSPIDARITIFSTDGPGCPSISAQCQGDITFTARQAFRAKATDATTCKAVTPEICPWKGILLWQDGTASNPTKVVKLGGEASTVMAGTIYAPKAEVDINGGTSTTGCGGGDTASCLSIQIIAWRWRIDGGAVVDMPYDPGELYQLEQRGLVE